MESSSSGPERRSGGRQRSLMQGRICYGPQAAVSFPCAIRNLSPDGALLEVPADQGLPDQFTLIQVSKGMAFDVRLTWRTGDRVGVAFLARHDLHEAASPEHRQLRRIWLALVAS